MIAFPNSFLLGRDGQIGHELLHTLPPQGLRYAIDHTTCDIGDLNKLDEALAHFRANVIINAAAYTDTDLAEDQAETVYRTNTNAVSVLADFAAKTGALLVHYSTDYVFDGTKPAPYTENDSPNPLSVYGKSKALADKAIFASGCKHLIFRTSWVFSSRGRNFLRTILSLAAEKESLSVVADQYGAPTSAELIADVTGHAIREVLAGRAAGGLYNLVAAGETSWYEYANFALERASSMGASLKCTKVQPISSADYGARARRPANSRLDTSKLQKEFGLRLPDWREGVEQAVAEIVRSERE